MSKRRELIKYDTSICWDVMQPLKVMLQTKYLLSWKNVYDPFLHEKKQGTKHVEYNGAIFFTNLLVVDN